MDKNYWENYYKNTSHNQRPSLFAQFILANYVKAGETLMELGCGNGRDSIFFAQNDIRVYAMDQCEGEIQSLKENLKKENIQFTTSDFTKLGDIGTFDVIYSRFTLHSITEEEEDRVIEWSYNSLAPEGRLCIEVRGKKNEIYGMGVKVEGQKNAYIYDSHYRRFVDVSDLKKKLGHVGFKVLLSEEKKGFAPYNDTDYTFLRIIAKK